MSDNNTTEQPTKEEIRRQIGKILQDKRAMLGFNYERVSQTIKLRASYLKALEDGNWDELPGDVYGRSFAGRYAQFLGLNPQELLAPYLRAQASAPTANSVGSPSSVKDRESTKSGYFWGGVLFVSVLGIFQLLRTNDSKPKMEVPQSMINATSPIVASSAPAAGGVLPGSHQVEIFSPLQLWVSIKAEDRKFEGFIPQDSTWTFKARGSFVIRLGHTQNVAMQFDKQFIKLDENHKRLSLPQ